MMPPTRCLALVCGSVMAVFGQVPVSGPHIRGTVIDSTTRQPIPNARVQVIGGADALTSPNGNYDIPIGQAGSYDLKVEAQGYHPEVDSHHAVLAGGQDSATVDMRMYRPGVITGRLVDAETKEPIEGITLTTRRVVYRFGRVLEASSAMLFTASVVPPTRGVRTGPQGNFRIDQLRPGSYSLTLQPEVAERMVNSSPRTPPAPAAEKGYRRQRWPAQESGVELRPGAVLELGDILIAREPLYKITGVLIGCPVGDDFSRGLLLSAGTLRNIAVAPVACGEHFLAENLSPGEYSFSITQGNLDVRAGRVTVVNRDVEFNPVFATPLTIRGTVFVPEGFSRGALAVKGTPASVAPDGSFEFTVVNDDPIELGLEPAPPPPYYVSEILYNGAPLRDGLLEVNRYTGVQELRIRISADGASLNGVVRKDNLPAPDSSVILVAWPQRLKNGFPVHYLADARDGRFAFPVVPPGSYRALAVEREAWETEMQKPGILSSLASAGTQVVLAPSSSRELTLEVRWIPISP